MAAGPHSVSKDPRVNGEFQCDPEIVVTSPISLHRSWILASEEGFAISLGAGRVTGSIQGWERDWWVSNSALASHRV